MSWFDVDAQSGAIAVGDAVCLSPYGEARRATDAALREAGLAVGVALSAAAPRGRVRVATSGLVPPSVTGLAAGSVGLAGVRDGRVARLAARGPSDPVLGVIGQGGGLTLAIEAPATLTGNPIANDPRWPCLQLGGDGMALLGPAEDARFAGSAATFECWLRVDALPTTGRGTLFEKGAWGLFFVRVDGVVQWNTTLVDADGRVNGHEVWSMAPVAVAQWTHIAIVIDPAARTYRMLVNGQPQAERHWGARIQGDQRNPSALGARLRTVDGGLQGYEGFQGALAEVRIWKTGRTDAQINEGRVRRASDAERAALAAWWPLDEGAGASVRDVVTGRLAPLSGGVRWDRIPLGSFGA